MEINYERFERILEETIEHHRKFQKKEILQEILLKEIDKIESLLSKGIPKKTIYDSIVKFFEEEGIGKVSYKYFLEILNEVLRKKQKLVEKSTDSKTNYRPQKINPLDLLK